MWTVHINKHINITHQYKYARISTIANVHYSFQYYIDQWGNNYCLMVQKALSNNGKHRKINCQ